MSIRISVIGAGNHSGIVHGPSLKQFNELNPNEIELNSVCDINKEKAGQYAEKFGFSYVYSDYNEMIAKESPDAILAITPFTITRKIAGDLLEREIPVLIEKPLGINLTEASELLAIAQKSKTPHMVSLERRFIPAVMLAKKWIGENAGKRPIEFVSAKMSRHNRIDTQFLTETAIHAIDLTLSFCGIPNKITSSIWTCGNDTKCSISTLNFMSCMANIIITPKAGFHCETYDIIGEDYTLRIDAAQNTFRVIDNNKETMFWASPDNMPRNQTMGGLGEIDAFVKLVRDKTRPEITLEEALHSQQTAQEMAKQPG